MHQRGGRGKPLRLICLPAQLDYFLSGQPPAGSAPPPRCPGMPPSCPPACAYHRRCHKRDGDPPGLGLQETSSVSLWQVLWAVL